VRKFSGTFYALALFLQMSRAEKDLLTHFWALDMLVSLAQQCCTCSCCAQPEMCMSQRCGVELRHWGMHAPLSMVKWRSGEGGS